MYVVASHGCDYDDCADVLCMKFLKFKENIIKYCIKTSYAYADCECSGRVAASANSMIELMYVNRELINRMRNDHERYNMYSIDMYVTLFVGHLCNIDKFLALCESYVRRRHYDFRLCNNAFNVHFNITSGFVPGI